MYSRRYWPFQGIWSSQVIQSSQKGKEAFLWLISGLA